MKYFFLVILILCLVGYAAFQYGRMRALIVVGTNIANAAKPFERAATKTTTERILVLGDSTAYGTGATTPEDSTAGRLAADHPNAEVINLGKNGAKADEVNTILETQLSLDTDRYSIILIQVGANDVIRLGNLNTVEKSVRSMIEQASKRADKVILMHGGDVGTVLLFPKPYRLLLGYRTQKLRSIYQDAVAGYEHVRYVDIIGATAATDPFVNDPAVFYASDYLHPSSAGYAFWYTEITRQLEGISIKK